jgi:hypothetical protein
LDHDQALEETLLKGLVLLRDPFLVEKPTSICRNKEARRKACMDELIAELTPNTRFDEIKGYRVDSDRPELLWSYFSRFISKEMKTAGCAFVLRDFRLRRLYGASTVGALRDEIHGAACTP